MPRLLLVISVMLGMARSSFCADEADIHLIRRVADAVLVDFPQPPEFNWGEGVLMTGMMRAWKATGDDRYVRFVEGFAAHWNAKGIGPLLNAKGYCGHWGSAFAMLELHEATKNPAAAALSDQVIDYILNKARRTRDGGLSHFADKPQLWVDTLDMACPVLSTASRLRDRPDLQTLAVDQLLIFNSRLSDPQTGLWYHLWDDATSKRSDSFWARGNGWAAISLVETLRNELADSESAAKLKPILQKLLITLTTLQDRKTGLWHTILDAPETYLETSASAMFMYAMVEAKKLGMKADDAAISRAWSGLKTRVDDKGHVIGVSGGTMPFSKERYAAVPTGTYTWGTGAFLMTAAAHIEQPRSTQGRSIEPR